MVDVCVSYGVASSNAMMHGSPALKISDFGNRGLASFARGGRSEAGFRNSVPIRAEEISGIGLGRKLSHGTDIHVGFSRRSIRSWDWRARAKVDNEQQESVGGSEEEQARASSSGDSEKRGGLVESIEAEMGRQFGGPLWFAVLLFSLAVFGGGYVYLIINYTNWGDIPIISGPKR